MAKGVAARTWAMIVALPVASLAEAGCGCTLMGCIDGLYINFRLETQGRYTLTAEVDGEVIACTATLPFDGTERCDGPGGAQYDSGGSPSDDQIAGMSVSVVGAQSVHLVITRDGVTILDEAFHPQWRDDSPNGEACAPTCSVAEENFHVD